MSTVGVRVVVTVRIVGALPDIASSTSICIFTWRETARAFSHLFTAPQHGQTISPWLLRSQIPASPREHLSPGWELSVCLSRTGACGDRVPSSLTLGALTAE